MHTRNAPKARHTPKVLVTEALIVCAATAALLAPAHASAGTAISSVPNLPSGARAGGDVTVKETGIVGHVLITQTFNGGDAGATARLRLIRLSLNCGPGPSVGNPGANGPAINNPETPCTNPDLGVFGNVSPTGTGSLTCAGTNFAITAPDAQGQVDMVPTAPVYLRNGESCEITFTFDVLKEAALDTFPNAAGMHTTSVSSVRSEIVSNPGNPAGVGLQAAGLGSGDAILVKLPTCADDPTLPGCTTDCTTNPSASGCTTTNCDTDPSGANCARAGSKKPASAKMKFAAKCKGRRLRASVTGSGIKKVTYLVDGRVLKVVKGGSPFKLNVAGSKVGRGAHRVTASVAFKDRSSPSQVMNKRVSACASAAAAPNFTG